MSKPKPPYVRFYNRAAADDRVYNDRIYGQVYNEENEGYGSDVTLSQLFDQAQGDPQLASILSEMFMIEGANTPEFTERFMNDPNFARLYVDVEGSRGKKQKFKTYTPKYRGDMSLPDNQGNCGAGAGVACSGRTAGKVARQRVAKGANWRDKVKARIKARMALSGAPDYSRTEYKGSYDRSGERTPDEYRNQVITSLADRDVGNLLMMLGAMSSQNSSSSRNAQ